MSPQSPMCEDRAKMSQEILGKLLETAPTFSNFFSSHSSPLTSTKTLKLINFKTLEERQEVFRPLELDIADQLQQQEGDLTVEGLYAPQGNIQILFSVTKHEKYIFDHIFQKRGY